MFKFNNFKDKTSFHTQYTNKIFSYATWCDFLQKSYYSMDDLMYIGWYVLFYSFTHLINGIFNPFPNYLFYIIIPLGTVGGVFVALQKIVLPEEVLQHLYTQLFMVIYIQCITIFNLFVLFTRTDILIPAVLHYFNCIIYSQLVYPKASCFFISCLNLSVFLCLSYLKLNQMNLIHFIIVFITSMMIIISINIIKTRWKDRPPTPLRY